jgi:hypothetical protein
MRSGALADPDGVDAQRTRGDRWEAHGIREKPAINHIKRFSHHRGKDEISQNAEAKF